MSIFVAGYLDVRDYPKTEKELIIDEDRVTENLPLQKRIPLNIEHEPDSAVGWVLNVFRTKAGLFCVGLINSSEFLDLIRRLYGSSAIAQASPQPGIAPDPLLQTLHAWLPELSLSSLRPETAAADEGEPRDDYFDHVSLCALGRRRGTVAVYGPSLDWTLARFETLDEEDARLINSYVATLDLQDLPRVEFNANMEFFISKLIDSGFIQNRLDALKTDRRVAGVSTRATYLRASQVPTVLQPPSGESDPSEPRAVMSQPPQEEFITVPKATFLSMLQSNLDIMGNRHPTTNVHPGPAPILPVTPANNSQPPIYQHYVPQTTVPPILYHQPPTGFQPPPPSNFAPPGSPFQTGVYTQNFPPSFPFITGLPQPGFGMGFWPYQPHPRGSKRKRDDDGTFPGEQRDVDISTLAKSLNNIEAELKDLKTSTTHQTKENLGWSSIQHQGPMAIPHQPLAAPQWQYQQPQTWPPYPLPPRITYHPHNNPNTTPPTSVVSQNEDSPKIMTPPGDKDEHAPEQKQPSKAPVNASCSSKMDHVDPKQKIFCEALISKQ